MVDEWLTWDVCFGGIEERALEMTNSHNPALELPRDIAPYFYGTTRTVEAK